MSFSDSFYLCHPRQVAGRLFSDTVWQIDSSGLSHEIHHFVLEDKRSNRRHLKLGIMVHTYNLSTQELRQEDYCEFESNMGYVRRYWDQEDLEARTLLCF